MSDLIGTMYNSPERKRFYLPSKLVWGVDCRELVLDLLESHPSVVLFIDQHFADHSMVAGLKRQLGARLASTHVCSNMPRAQDLIAIADATTDVPDAVLSIGGGSTVDAAKAVVARWLYGTFDGIGMGAKLAIEPRRGVKRPLMIGMPTTAGTGADVSRYYVTYDAVDHSKVHGKSWHLLVDWVLVDPAFLRDAPNQLLVISAFDAFIHFFESYICRYESSWFGEMLSLDGMTRILAALHRVLDNDRSDNTLLALNYAATVGGVAISNIRTGNIHEAAGGLLELTPLTHAETLYVFFEPAYRQYRDAIVDREKLLIRHLTAHAPELGFDSFESIIQWWRHAFTTQGLLARIEAAMRGVSDRARTHAHVYDRVIKDRVWCEKESPLPLSATDIEAFLNAAFMQYWNEPI